MRVPIPVTLIGGYLGAGKTTLVNQVLRQAQGARIAVLVNEFGMLAIDEDLIEAKHGNLISIAGGCICCSFGNHLTASLIDVARHRPSFDHILIEASGVAMPGAIAHGVTLIEDISLEAICVLVDGVNFERMLSDEYVGDTVMRQIDDADLLVLTKADLLDADAFGHLQTVIGLHWPSKSLVTAAHGHVPNSLLLGALSKGDWKRRAVVTDDAYRSVSLVMNSITDVEQLVQCLMKPSMGVIRAKGFVDDWSGRCAHIQIVGQRAEISYALEPKMRGLVCIGIEGCLQVEALQQLACQ